MASRFSKIIFLCFFPFIVRCKSATVIPTYNKPDFDQDIKNIYKNPKSHYANLPERVKVDSQFFINKPYVLGALGEGGQALFDKSPLYRTDVFDCTTFVSTVLALVRSDSLTEFKRNIIKIRYKDANISFVSRNHFISVDWNPNNEKNGYLKDINNNILDENGRPIATKIYTLIDKPQWYKNLPMATIKNFKKVSQKKSGILLKKLHDLSSQVKVEESVMSYLPINKLFTNQKPNQNIFAQIPSGVVIQIVRQEKGLKKLIGTDLNISHMGLGLRMNGELIFREASITDKKIKDITMKDYLKQFLDDSTVKGIRLEKILKK